MGEKNAQMKSICCGGKKKGEKSEDPRCIILNKIKSSSDNQVKSKLILPRVNEEKCLKGARGKKVCCILEPVYLQRVFSHEPSTLCTLPWWHQSSAPHPMTSHFVLQSLKKKQLLFKKSSSYFGRCFKAAVTQVYDLTLLHLWNVVQQPTRVGSTSSVKDS